MPTSCGAVNANILANCDNKPVGGVDSLITYINYADWVASTVTYDATNPLIVTAITLPSGGKKAYQLGTFRRGFKPKFEGQDTDYGMYYKHSIVASLPIWDDATKLQVQALAEGYGVIIVENVQKTGSVFEIYGAGNGLRMPDIQRDLGANEGVLNGTFTNDTDMNEPKPPLTFKTVTGTYAANKAALAALLVATT